MRELVAARWNDYDHSLRVPLLHALEHFLAHATAADQHVVADVHTVVLSLLHSPHPSMDVCASEVYLFACSPLVSHLPITQQFSSHHTWHAVSPQLTAVINVLFFRMQTINFC